MTTVIPAKFDYVSSTFKDENIPLWNKDKNYAVGDEVLYKELIYKNALGGISSTAPDDDRDRWVNMGALNSKRFMDSFIYTKSTSEFSSEIVINVLKPINTISFFNLEGAWVEISDMGGNLLANRLNLTYKKSRTWWEYFFKGFIFRHTATIDLNNFKGKMKIKIHRNKNGSALGHLILGNKFYIGATIYGAKVGVIDYSKIITNEFGDKDFYKGKNAKYNDLQVVVKSERVDDIIKELSKLAGTIALFIGDERSYGFESLVIYGYYKDFNILIDNYKTSECQISIEGVI